MAGVSICPASHDSGITGPAAQLAENFIARRIKMMGSFGCVYHPTQLCNGVCVLSWLYLHTPSAALNTEKKVHNSVGLNLSAKESRLAPTRGNYYSIITLYVSRSSRGEANQDSIE